MIRTGLVWPEKMVQVNQHLLKIISGNQSPTSGQIDMSKEITIGYLPQQMKVDDTTTVINETSQHFQN
jgi:ATP-binding cassette subfamily F protein 3